VLQDQYFRVDAAPLDHKIVSMAYAVTERTHLNVRPGTLEEHGLRPGPWLNVLKTAVRGGAADETRIEVAPGQARPLGVLRDALLDVTPGQKVAYVVDTLFSPANAARIVELARDADVFYCESPFLDEDIEQATRRYHLTARQAGALARAARARRLNVFHFSPRYEGRYGEIVAEAHAEYQGHHVRYGDLDGRHPPLS
jgi:ribonuclease Z